MVAQKNFPRFLKMVFAVKICYSLYLGVCIYCCCCRQSFLFNTAAKLRGLVRAVYVQEVM